MIIAIDGGGSKCFAQLYLADDTTNAIGSYTGGPANIASDFDGATSNILSCCQQLLAACGYPARAIKNCHVVGGFAGVNLPQIAQRLKNWPHPFKQFDFTTDLHIACYAAHQSRYGKVIIIGTGSCGLAISEKQEIMIGGYGLQLSDQASGAWLGQQAIKHTLLVLDGLQKDSPLSEEMCRLSASQSPVELSQHWYQASPCEFAKLASTVMQLAAQKEPAATFIVQQASDYLSTLIQRLNQEIAGPVCLMGGMAQYYINHLSTQNEVKLSTQHPVSGALLLLAHPTLAINNHNI
ncbi:BadF/BadG/BcrA/BcrD ATPase family protein [Catenovulum sediminis]|uniref:BadF/BadG/BcrA/BcrD ATPase family protein n=1 Tax=Catenovulum sediminis TaxID=1740262 RepID=A0ABV1RF70_9ALTE